MKALYQMFALVISLVFLLGSCNRQVDPSTTTEQRYKHDLFSSDEECHELNPMGEVSCSETIQLRPDGKADILLGGGDVRIRTDYTRTDQAITLKATGGLPKAIVFTVVSQTELVRTDNGTNWQMY